MIRRLRALWVLAWALVKHVIFSPFVRTQGPAPWLAQLSKESLGPTPKAAWEYLEKTSRCLGCGLCDGIVLQDAAAPLSQTLISVARKPEDAPLALTEATSLRVVAAEVAKVCPARVCTEDIARLLEDNARALGHRASEGAAR